MNLGKSKKSTILRLLITFFYFHFFAEIFLFQKIFHTPKLFSVWENLLEPTRYQRTKNAKLKKFLGFVDYTLRRIPDADRKLVFIWIFCYVTNFLTPRPPVTKCQKFFDTPSPPKALWSMRTTPNKIWMVSCSENLYYSVT